MKSGIYQILNLKNGKIYVGSAVSLSKRREAHFRLLNNDRHHNIHLQRAWNKQAGSNFIFQIILNCHKDVLLLMEQHFIDTLKPEYNICKVAGSHLGMTTPHEVKIKISKSLKGRKRSEETKKRMGKHNIGKKLSEEHKKKLIDSHIGKAVSEETKDKIRNTIKNNPKSDRIPIVGFDKALNIIGKWGSYTEASSYLDIPVSCICDVLKGRVKYTRGLTFIKEVDFDKGILPKKQLPKINVFKDNCLVGQYPSIRILSKELGVHESYIGELINKNKKYKDLTFEKL